MIVRESTSSDVVVVGAGMVAHRFVESLLRGDGSAPTVTVLGEEARAPYDRVGLTSFFTGASADDLALDPQTLQDDRVRFIGDDRVTGIDRARRTVRTRSGAVHAYGTLVLATGSYAMRRPSTALSSPAASSIGRSTMSPRSTRSSSAARRRSAARCAGR